MGTLALHSELDITGVKIEVKATMTDKPRMRIGAIDIDVSMPAGLTETDRKKLEAAAEHCPIKHSFAEDVVMTVQYHYPD